MDKFISLPNMDLQLFADNSNDDKPIDNNQPIDDGQKPKDDVKPRDNKKPSIPYERFKEVNDRMKRAERELEELKTANLTEYELVNLELEQAQTRLKELENEVVRGKVEKILTQGGISEELYSNFIDNIVGDEEVSISTANEIVKMVDKIIKDTEKQIKADILKETPKPPKGDLKANKVSSMAKRMNEMDSGSTKTLWD